MLPYFYFFILWMDKKKNNSLIRLNWVIMFKERKYFPRGQYHASFWARLSAAAPVDGEVFQILNILIRTPEASKVLSLKCVTIKKKTTSTERLLTQNLNKWSIITKIQATVVTITSKTCVIQMTMIAMSKFGRFLPLPLLKHLNFLDIFCFSFYVRVHLL